MVALSLSNVLYIPGRERERGGGGGGEEEKNQTKPNQKNRKNKQTPQKPHQNNQRTQRVSYIVELNIWTGAIIKGNINWTQLVT